MWRSLLLSLYIQCISVFGSDDDDEKTYSFKVNPGGQLLHHEETRDWLMKISLNAKGEYSCTVERPGSYLFFQSFELKVTGAKSVEGYAFGQISNPLNPDEYSLDFDSKNVGTIKQVDGKFKSQLQMVYIKALQGTKEEL
ncbi:hypothetical protein FSP39_023844 [Pinctada imbricata]|uniref:Immunoglobulin V-set domain-containing protein n=1 Tax=Pinctada imbricata TaxID=66713 RepID=A0AA88YKX4_PINIB|nr:hypothetical protein FSP39_023844 [Pinctada imbricata]